MSKQPEDLYLGDGELPPPYSPEPNTNISNAPASASSSVHPESLFAAHLASVRCQIRAQQATRASLQDQHDTQLLAMLIPHVEEVLASVAATEPPPRLFQATLVPGGAVTSDWTPAETYEDQPGETHTVVRVPTQPDTKSEGDRKQHPGATTGASTGAGISEPKFDGWGGWGEDVPGAGNAGEEKQLWWNDEDLAVRLAKYLQPASKVAVAVDRPTVAAKVTEAKKSRSRWNILGGSSSGGSTSPTTATSAASRPAASVQIQDDVSMTVAAEEVTFRRENAMGLWESNTGWGVVVRVRIRI